MSSELERFLADRENRLLFEEERLILEITEAISALMNERGITRSELAERLSCSPSNVTQILDGTNNFTVRTVADLLFELDSRLTVETEALSYGRDCSVVLENPRFPAHPQPRYSSRDIPSPQIGSLPVAA